MKQVLLLFIFGIPGFHVAYSQQNNTKQEAEKEIRMVLQKQELAWNNYDLDEFMEGYWKSDSLLFVSSQITRGWAVTLGNYRQKYSNQVEIGSLKFDVLDVRPLTPEVYVVTGSYYLTRTTTDLGGLFTLLFQKKKGKWVIVYDHTS